MAYERPPSFTEEEAYQHCIEQLTSPQVVEAHPVTFADVTHVHLDLIDGDICVFGPDRSYHVEM